MVRPLGTLTGHQPRSGAGGLLQPTRQVRSKRQRILPAAGRPSTLWPNSMLTPATDRKRRPGQAIIWRRLALAPQSLPVDTLRYRLAFGRASCLGDSSCF